MTNYTLPIVSTSEDIQKKIEIEIAHLMYLEYIPKDEAVRKATLYIEEKYKDVVDKLRAEGKYS